MPKRPITVRLGRGERLPETSRRIVRIDRRTRWGNPEWMRDRSHVERLRVIACYAVHLRRRIAAGEVTRAELAALCGTALACWCAPKPCHGDVIADAAVAAAASDRAWEDWLDTGWQTRAVPPPKRAERTTAASAAV